MLFAAPHQVAARAALPGLSDSIAEATRLAGGPELVDDGPETAPSKRLASMLPGFTKTLDGPAIVKAAGLSSIRSECPHLDAWIHRLESSGNQ